MHNANRYRIASIDVLRGLVMVVMALDHTRDFFHNTAMTRDPLDPATTTAALFFTRWITHFCAPTFVMLSGLSAYLSSRSKPRNEASLFLIKRGLWLVLIEVTVVTFGITFNPFYNFVILQVIWAIGWSMVVLGLLMRLSYAAILVTGLLLFFGHNALDHVTLPAGALNVLTTILLTSRSVIYPLSNTHVVAAFYAILPWTAVMLLGYSLGPWFLKDFAAERRKKLLLITGFALIILFIFLRYAQGYGDPGVWEPGDHSFFSFLNTNKYPPSLQYCCMTLGPALVFLAMFENLKNGFSKTISVYGRVPFFYYILHFYILHILLVIVFFASGYSSKDIADPQSPFGFRPITFGYQLPMVYLIWLAVVASLYLPCRWFTRYKMNHRDWWLSYV